MTCDFRAEHGGCIKSNHHDWLLRQTSSFLNVPKETDIHLGWFTEISGGTGGKCRRRKEERCAERPFTVSVQQLHVSLPPSVLFSLRAWSHRDANTTSGYIWISEVQRKKAQLQQRPKKGCFCVKNSYLLWKHVLPFRYCLCKVSYIKPWSHINILVP